MTSILDLEAVHQAVVENGGVSPSLHLYVLVRQAFLNSGIDEAGIADEVAGGLVEKLGIEDGVRTFHFMCLIRNMADVTRFHIQAAAGDNFLILNGDLRMAPGETSDSSVAEDRDPGLPVSERCTF